MSHAPGPFDYVVSLMVLQHVPVARGLAILDGLLDRVTPAVAFSFTSRSGRITVRCAGFLYPLGRVIALLAARGATDLDFSVQPYPRFFTVGIAGRMLVA